MLYVNEKELAQVVVLNPVKYLVEPATAFIFNSTIHQTEEQEEAAMADREGSQCLTQDARLTRKFLQRLWGTRKDHERLLEFMTKYGLLVPLQEVDLAKDMQWLVPSMLQPKPFESPTWSHKQEFVLWFTARSDKAHENMNLDDMMSSRAGGFLPKGIVPHVLGAMVRLSEDTVSPLAGMASKITKDWALLALGSTQVLVHVEERSHSLRFYVEGTLPLKVVEVVHREVGTVLGQCAPQLTAVVMVPCPTLPKQYVSYSVLQKSRKLVVGGTVLERETFRAWIRSSGLLDFYHFFCSYRWPDERSKGDDAALLQRMVDCLIGECIGDKQVEGGLWGDGSWMTGGG